MPVGQVAHVVRTTEEPIIWRKDREIVITAVADVVNGAQPPDVSAALWKKLAPIRDILRPAIASRWAARSRKSQKGNGSIFALFPIMIIAMLTLLMIQMQSFSRLAIVFFTAPLGIVGASIALNLAHRPFGFVALLGLIALAGMDMRNTVILVDQIETDVRERGLSRREAIVFSTMRRARPVALTARGGDPGDDPAVGERLLGPDGLDHHGRPVGRDLPDAVPAAGDLRAVARRSPGPTPVALISEGGAGWL